MSKVCDAVATAACAEMFNGFNEGKPSTPKLQCTVKRTIIKEFPLKLVSYAGVIRKIKWSNSVILSSSMSVISYSSRLKYAKSLSNNVPSISLITVFIIFSARQK